MEFLNDLDWIAPPVSVADNNNATTSNDLQLQDLFQQYLGQEVAKLPPSTEDYPFASGATAPCSTAAAAAPVPDFSNAIFDPSTFMPTLPGSPIGAFSPSSDNSGQRFGSMSPSSFPDLDDPAVKDNASQDWSFDTSLFGPASSSLNVTPAAVAPVFETSALPDLPVIPEQMEEEKAAPVPETSIVITKRFKRQHSTPIADAIEEESAVESDDSEYASRPKRRTGNNKKKQRSVTPSTVISTVQEPTPSTSQRQPKTSVAQFATKELHYTNARVALPPVPDWTDKPDPETYKKLSSKEKRQLRNKISARNFRHRRKEQLSGLEEEIQNRDQIIAQLRDEVGVMKAENTSLRSEVTMLKQKWDEMIQKMASMSDITATSATASAGLGVNTKLAMASTSSAPSPASIKTEESAWALDSPRSSSQELEPAVAAPSTGRRTRGSNGIVKPNLNKDIAPGMPRRTNSWTTNSFGGGFMPVHTTLVPEVNFATLNAKPPLYSGSFNPTINTLSSSQMAQLPSMTSHLRGANVGSQQSSEPSKAPKGTFEDFFGSNPLWLRADQVEEYRASLYGKLAHNAAGLQASQKLQQSTGSPNLPVPAGFRPAFFSNSASLRFDPPPPYSPPAQQLDLASEKTSGELFRAQSTLGDERRAAAVASMATQTLFSRMASAFMDAFMGNEPTSAGAARSFNADKVASVLSGQSRLAIVPNDVRPTSDLDNLDASFSRLNLQPETRQSCSFDEVRRWISGARQESKSDGTRSQ